MPSWLTSAELEITFLKKFCRASNLSALIEDDKLPEALKQFSSRLKALYLPPERRRNQPSNSKLTALSDDVLELLVDYLNKSHREECIWLSPEDWASLSKSDSIGYSPVPARAQFHKRVQHTDGYISTFTQNPDDCIVYFKTPEGTDCFARVFSIFSHCRAAVTSQNTTDLWLCVQCFPPLPRKLPNPFNTSDFEVQCALRMWSPTETKLIKLDEVIAQCAWVMYKPGDLNRHVNVPTIGMVILNR